MRLATFARAPGDKTLTTRIYGVVPLADWQRLRDVVTRKEYGGADGRGDEWLRVGGLKGFVDGSLGSHTAAFHQPFDDAPKDRGLLVNTPEDLYRWISGADKAGLQVMVHAIGDRANGLLLDIFERVGGENGAARPPVPDRARPAPRRRRHSAIREARRIAEHAAVSRDRRRTVGRRSTSVTGSRRPTRSAR